MQNMGELSPPPHSTTPSVALVVGVTGMVGLSLVNALKKPAPAGGPSPSWTVYGVARRSPVPPLYSNSLLPKLDRFIELDVLDRTATLRTLSPLAPHVTHLFWVTLAERPTDSATSAANSAMLTNVLDALLLCGSPRLRHVAIQTGTKHYYWAYLSDPARSCLLDVPFKEDSPRNPRRPLFYYDLEDILVNYSLNKPIKLTWTVHRASLILGASDRSLYNVLLTLAAYALICRHERAPFLYPGSEYTWQHFCDVSDADLLAEHQIWAGTTPGARNQAFNCTNGDVFIWRSFWKVLCGCFHVEFVDECGGGGPEWVGRMMGKGRVWDEIVRENRLCETKLEEITCFAAVECILNFGFQHVSCMNKSREYGFCKSVDTLKSVSKWVDRLRDMNIIPKH